MFSDGHLEARFTDRRNKPWNSELLFDHRWLTVHHAPDNHSEFFPGTGEPKDGYLAQCDLTMESELDTRGENTHADFQKLVMVKAYLKLFRSRYRNTPKAQSELKKFQAQIMSFSPNYENERYLVSLYCDDTLGFIHQSYDGLGREWG